MKSWVLLVVSASVLAPAASLALVAGPATGGPPPDTYDTPSVLATRSLEAAQTRTGADGLPLEGHGVSIAVIDEGVDPTHPAFQDPGGSAVVASLKVLCTPLTAHQRPEPEECRVDRVPLGVSTDLAALGGHGTAASGAAIGRPVTLTTGETVRGAAPAAKLVSLSAATLIAPFGTQAALKWVLENHEAPCGPGVSADVCPPIKVVSNSYGPFDGKGGPLEEWATTVELQRQLVAEGVVMVWGNGNSGGDGSVSMSNPPSTDPTPGIVSVGWYDDLRTGTRDGRLSDDSARGEAGEPDTYPDVVAPGEKVTVACRIVLPVCNLGLDPQTGPGPLDLGNYNVLSGTSFSTPIVAGIVADLFQADPGATPAEIEDVLETTAHRFGGGAAYEPSPTGPTSYDKGHGLVDTVAAVDALTGR
jgi:serine protease AprX